MLQKDMLRQIVLKLALWNHSKRLYNVDLQFVKTRPSEFAYAMRMRIGGRARPHTWHEHAKWHTALGKPRESPSVVRNSTDCVLSKYIARKLRVIIPNCGY